MKRSTIFSRFILGPLYTAEDIWRDEGGLVANVGGLLLVDRAACRPDVPAKNIRQRWQVIRNNADQTLVKLFRSRAAAMTYLRAEPVVSLLASA